MRDVDVVVNLAGPGELELLRNMMELYLYDFSEFDGADLDAHGRYGYEWLDGYVNDDGCYAYVIRVNSKLAGFALVDGEVLGVSRDHSIAEFFVLKKYRCVGVGRSAAFQIFDALPGRWEIGQLENNVPAQQFWRRVIAAYTHGSYEENFWDDENWTGPVQSFDNVK